MQGFVLTIHVRSLWNVNFKILMIWRELGSSVSVLNCIAASPITYPQNTTKCLLWPSYCAEVQMYTCIRHGSAVCCFFLGGGGLLCIFNRDLLVYLALNRKTFPYFVTSYSPGHRAATRTYCNSTKFDRYKIWRIHCFLGDNRGFSLYNPILFLSQRLISQI